MSQSLELYPASSINCPVFFSSMIMAKIYPAVVATTQYMHCIYAPLNVRTQRNIENRAFHFECARRTSLFVYKSSMTRGV